MHFLLSQYCRVLVYMTYFTLLLVQQYCVFIIMTLSRTCLHDVYYPLISATILRFDYRDIVAHLFAQHLLDHSTYTQNGKRHPY